MQTKYFLMLPKKIAFFKPKDRFFETDLKLKMGDRNLFPSHHVRYLTVKIYELLAWSNHVNQLCVKLVKANDMLLKVWYLVNETSLDLFISIMSNPDVVLSIVSSKGATTQLFY